MMNMKRHSKEMKIGNVIIGNGRPVAIQSMCNTDTRDIKSTVTQLRAFKDAGCDIARLAIPDMQAADAISKIKKQVSTNLPFYF